MLNGNDTMLLVISAIIMLSLVPLNLMTTALLYRIRKSDTRAKSSRSLKERYRVSMVLMFASFLGAFLAIMRLYAVAVDPSSFGNPISVFAVTAIVILISIPGIMYVWSYFSDWFSE